MLLITGASGQLGQCFQDVFSPQELSLTDVAEYFTKLQWPVCSLLDKTKLKNTFNLSVPHWTKGVEECLKKLF